MEGNQMKMREALSLVHQIADTAKSDFDVFAGIERIRRISMSALSEPPRQCDVGTPEEQSHGFQDFCDEHSSGIGTMCDYNCPCFGCVDECHCQFKWAQMPYEAKEGAEHGEA